MKNKLLTCLVCLLSVLLIVLMVLLGHAYYRIYGGVKPFNDMVHSSQLYHITYQLYNSDIEMDIKTSDLLAFEKMLKEIKFQYTAEFAEETTLRTRPPNGLWGDTINIYYPDGTKHSLALIVYTNEHGHLMWNEEEYLIDPWLAHYFAKLCEPYHEDCYYLYRKQKDEQTQENG